MELILILHGLVFLMIITAVITVETPNLTSSIISLGVLGFLMSLSFLLLGAPDVAIIQIVIEVIILAILIRVTSNRDKTAVSGDREFTGLVITISMVLIFGLIGLNVFAKLPIFGSNVLDRIADAPALTYLAQGLSVTGAHNMIQSILFEFRGYDILGIAAIVFAAAIGAISLLRQPARKNVEAADADEVKFEAAQPPLGMSVVVQTATRWLKGFIMLFGIYLVLNGHKTPGGSFAGGAIITCALILVILSSGQRKAALARNIALAFVSLGMLMVIGLGIVSQMRTGIFFKSFEVTKTLFSSFAVTCNSIQLFEIAIAIIMSAGLFLVFSSLSTLAICESNGCREITHRKRN